MFTERIKTHHSGHPKKSTFSSEEELFEFLENESPKQKDGAIYFHVPFCDNICSFCSMNRTKLDGELDEYTEFLLSEIDKYSKFNYIKQKSFESIYFGGGTPTTLKERHLERIITAINEKFNLSPTCEFSFESTLHNLSISKVRMMQSLGVNRYSIGIQTFDDEGRKLLNRVHSKTAAIDHLAKIKEEFKGLVCTDIIYNYPNQTEAQVREDAKILKELGVDSTSFYSLMFIDGSKLSKEISQDYYDLKIDKMLHHAFVDEMFRDGDYEFLEYTKINRKGRDEYKYIRLSHSGADVLPLGIGAGGGVGDFGIFNMKKKMKMVGILPPEEKNRQKFIALFQYVEVKFSDMLKYIGQNKFSELMEFFKKCEAAGYMHVGEEAINLSVEGVFWGNTIANEVMKITAKEFE